MSEPTLYQYVMKCFQTLRYTRQEVAAGSGVPFSTVCKVAQGSTKDPSVHTVQALADFFRSKESELAEQQEAA